MHDKPSIERTVLIVLDGVGIGALPDAHLYGDDGSNTLVNLAERMGGLKLPNLASLGLGNIAGISGVEPNQSPLGSFGLMLEVSPGKDTTIGHWELMGIQVKHPFPTYPDGFPARLIQEFESAISRGVIGNIAASGTEIIEELGGLHVQTGKPIVYTSADSVFQIAAHEEVIPLRELYDICLKARSILKPPHGVARVIARPFTGTPGNFHRTPPRKDFSIPPPGKTVLDILTSADVYTRGIGKIWDIFAGRGIQESFHSKDNAEGVSLIEGSLKEIDRGLIFANLIDFDMVYGHRNDCQGFKFALEMFDSSLPGIMRLMREDDLLIVTADHGCDPTTPSTDHSREKVPVLAYSPKLPARDLGTRKTFSDVGKTILDGFCLKNELRGKSFIQ